jgi:hypothetical protein
MGSYHNQEFGSAVLSDVLPEEFWIRGFIQSNITSMVKISIPAHFSLIAISLKPYIEKTDISFPLFIYQLRPSA